MPRAQLSKWKLSVGNDLYTLVPRRPRHPGSQVLSWDWNICHDWYWNSEGMVDVAPAPFTRGPEHRNQVAAPPVAPAPSRSRCRRVRRSVQPHAGALIIIPPICDADLPPGAVRN